MTLQTYSYSYLDGNAAAGELNRMFAVDVTTAKGECVNCGAERHFAEAHLYVQCPGIVARCALCGHVLLRLVDAGDRMLLDVRGITYFSVKMPQTQASNG